MLEITIQRRVDGSWPVVVEHHRAGTLLPVRSGGRLELAGEPMGYDSAFLWDVGRALFRDEVRMHSFGARNDGFNGRGFWSSSKPGN
jgi:hypothetical protein